MNTCWKWTSCSQFICIKQFHHIESHHVTLKLIGFFISHQKTLLFISMACVLFARISCTSMKTFANRILPGAKRSRIKSRFHHASMLQWLHKPTLVGVDRTGSGSISAICRYQNLVDCMFGGDCTKVIFGFFICDCSETGDNANYI